MRRAQLYINNTEVDLTEDISLPFTYQIADIRNPEQRTQSHSKTITIPASKVNNKLFSHIYEISYASQSTVINFDPDFNPNKKAIARVLIDGIEIFNGFAQLMKINKNGSKPESYEIVIFTDVIQLFSDVGTDTLQGLDFSEFDHVLDETIISSQTGTNYIDSVLTNYYNGQWDGSNYIATGLGYTYPNIDYGQNANTYWKVSKMCPAIPIRQYLIKIFEKYGYTYTSSLFDSQFFKQLIIPASIPHQQTVDEIRNGTNIDLDSSLTSAVVTNLKGVPEGDYIYALGDGTIGSFKFRDVNQDNLNTYDINTGAWRSKYKVQVFLATTITFKVFHYMSDSDIGETINGDNSLNITIGLYKKKVNGTIITLSEDVIFLTPYDSGTASSTLASPTYSALQTFTFNDSSVYDFDAGDLLYIGIDAQLSGYITRDSDGTELDNYVGIDFDYPSAPDPAQTLVVTLYEAGVVTTGYGQTLIMNNYIPNYPIKDLLNDLIKCFNLQIEPDKTIPKHLTFEAYNDYYTGSTIKDWTQKVDTSKTIEVVPMGDLSAKKYTYNFSEDKDSINEDYQNRFKGEVYGGSEMSIDNDFVKDVKDVKVTLAASPVFMNNTAGYFALTVLGNGYGNRIETKPRFLYYDLVNQYNGNVIYVNDSGAYLQEAIRYAQALEVDSITAPTFALRFSVVPKALYYSTSVMTNANFFTRYWKKYIQEITDKDSKIVTLYARLSALDIHNFNFSDTIFIDGNYFIVNKIEEYNPLLAETVKLELLKLKIYAPSIEGTQTIPTTVTSYNLVEGGEDEVRALDATSYYNLIEGGQDEVRDIGATSTIGIINGGQNIV